MKGLINGGMTEADNDDRLIYPTLTQISVKYKFALHEMC